MSAKPDQFSGFPSSPRGGRESLGWKLWQGDQADGPRASGPQSESGLVCVYNQTSERFLSVEVEAADFTVSGLELRLQNLSTTARIALWLIPFRGISPTSVRVPLDLLYLDRDCTIIEAVESFPFFLVSASSRPAASVLVLPARSITSTGTRPGDQLIFRSPAEMKLVLEQLAGIKGDSQQSRPGTQVAGAAQGLHQVLAWKDLSRPDLQPLASDLTPTPTFPAIPESTIAPLEFAPETLPAPAPEPSTQPTPQIQESPPKKKNWLERFLSAEPNDKRTALRESIPGLSAFFFTGGVPVPHGIRDISETGVYVLTDERWYPGTVVRITLTDQREPTAERSFTVNAMVTRWGNDGVGLHFIFQDKKASRRANMSFEERAMGIADAKLFKRYLLTLRGQNG
jgi:hypothetical protein